MVGPTTNAVAVRDGYNFSSRPSSCMKLGLSVLLDQPKGSVIIRDLRARDLIKDDVSKGSDSNCVFKSSGLMFPFPVVGSSLKTKAARLRAERGGRLYPELYDYNADFCDRSRNEWVYLVRLDSSKTWTDYDFIDLLRKIGCETRYIDRSERRKNLFFARLNDEEAARLLSVDGVRSACQIWEHQHHG